jgi:manganese/iron transport system permease protein
MAFFTEALQHTIFPGIAIAFVIGRSLMLGALVAAALTVALLAVLAGRVGIDTDATLAVLIASFFALGVVVVSHRDGYTTDLNQLLFGRILDVDRAQIITTACVGALVLMVVGACHKELVLSALDRTQAAALGYRVLVLDVVLNAAVALTVVVAVQAVGTVLVVAFVVTPAATARLVTRSVAGAMSVAVLLAMVLGWVGLSASFEASVYHDVRLAAGATVVVVFTAGFCLIGLGSLAVRRLRANAAVQHGIGAPTGAPS